MIENEVQTMRAVKHPNCVGLFDVFDTKDELFLVMELVEGGDLFDRIVEKGKYPESDAVRAPAHTLLLCRTAINVKCK